MKNKNEQELNKIVSNLIAEGAPSVEKNATAADAQPQTKEQMLPTKEDEFEELIKGEFKEQFEQRIKDNLKRRFKESSALKAKNAENEKIVSLIMSKYDIDDFDAEKIIQAISSDKTISSDKASYDGADDILGRISQLEEENRKMRAEKEEETMKKTISEWISDSEIIREDYPDFDIGQESENPVFVKLLKSGIGLKDAYFAMHHDEIIKTLVEKAAKEASEKTTRELKSKDSRPLENGMSQKSTALFKTDVSKLSPTQRDEIAKRVARGEIISF